jgi:RimJ/RimL family protein N-acetyltransferase
MDQKAWHEWQNNDPKTRMFVLERDVDGKDKQGRQTLDTQWLGVCGLTSIEMVPRRAEFSLYIAPKYQGMSYGKKALDLLFSFGFDELGLNLIWGETFAKNPATKLFEKMGMQCEGTRRDFYFKEGQFIDAWLYSIKRSEFCSG